MRTEAIERIDGFPYRHRVRDLMTAPVATLPPDAPLREAITQLIRQGISSIVVVDSDGRAIGILTERDVLRVITSTGGAALEAALRGAMTSPVAGVPPDSFIYRAVGRMNRLNVRHLPVLDPQGRPIGMLTTRILLALRSQQALALGDEVDVAPDPAALRAAHARLPALARALLAEDVPGTAIAAVIAAVTRDLTARAAELALAAMAVEGKGEPPCPWCLLVLGSAGRGETLLAPDQDNALILDPPADADIAAVDAWFAGFATRLNTSLDAAGVPFCKGGVMAREPAFRRTAAGWRHEVGRWIAHPDGSAVLAADIFFDMSAVAGDPLLAEALRRDTIAAASKAPAFLQQLATELDAPQGAIGLFGGFRLTSGRVDLKRTGLLPITAGARVLALHRGIAETGTDERLRMLTARQVIRESDAEDIVSARAIIVDAILRQQLADVAAGSAPGSRVDPSRLARTPRRRLRDAVKRTRLIAPIVESALSG